MAFQYTKEQAKQFSDYGVEILHRVQNAPIRMKPRAGARPITPQGDFAPQDMEPERQLRRPTARRFLRRRSSPRPTR